MGVICVLFALGAMPVLAVLGVMALQRKWHAFAAFAGVVVVIFAFFFGLAPLFNTSSAPPGGEGYSRGYAFVLAGVVATAFADLASLLAVPALFMRWGRDEPERE